MKMIVTMTKKVGYLRPNHVNNLNRGKFEMTRTEALTLLESGAELTEEERAAIAAALENNKTDEDDEDEWENSDWWESSSC